MDTSVTGPVGTKVDTTGDQLLPGEDIRRAGGSPCKFDSHV